MTSPFPTKTPCGGYSIPFARTVLSLYKRKNNKMVEELQKYKDILRRERKEFQKQLVREVSTSQSLLF